MSLLIKALWPFISEMFFGGKSIKDVILANKLISFLVLLLGLSFFLNYVALGKIYDIALARQKEGNKIEATAQPSADKASAPTAAPNNQGAASKTREDEVRDKLNNIFK